MSTALAERPATPRNVQENRPTAAPAGPPWRIAPAAAGLEGSAIRAILKLTERPEILSFAGGLPNPAAFPADAVRTASARVLADDATGALQYGPTEGYGPLREQVAERLTRAGQPTTPDQVLITTGSQQALDLVGRALLQPGAALLSANPGYVGALQAFALQSPRLFDIESAWDEAKENRGLSPITIKFCYLTPTFANPSGRTWETGERAALLRRLAAAGVPLVEDDPYGELWFDAPPPAACRALAPAATLYLGSFSKVLAPGLRVGYAAGPRPLIELLGRLKQAADLHTPSLNQRIVSALLADGSFDAQLPRLRALYRTQRDALLAALDRHLKPFADWPAPSGGMFAWLRLKDGRDAGRLLERALAEGVAYVPGAPFHFAAADRSTLRLAFSTVPAERIDEGMARLSRALAAADA